MLRECSRLVPGMPDNGALWALFPGTQCERTAVEHHGKAGIGPSASLWAEAREGRICAFTSVLLQLLPRLVLELLIGINA